MLPPGFRSFGMDPSPKPAGKRHMQLGSTLSNPEVWMYRETCSKAPNDTQRQILWGLLEVRRASGRFRPLKKLDAITWDGCFTEMTCQKELISERVASGVLPISVSRNFSAAKFLILEWGPSTPPGLLVAQMELLSSATQLPEARVPSKSHSSWQWGGRSARTCLNCLMYWF